MAMWARRTSGRYSGACIFSQANHCLTKSYLEPYVSAQMCPLVNDAKNVACARVLPLARGNLYPLLAEAGKALCGTLVTLSLYQWRGVLQGI
jgi:hypothetical protein